MTNSQPTIEHEVAAKAFETAASHAFHSIMITKSEPNGAGNKIVFVNDAFTEMTGFTSDEAVGKTPRILQGLKTDPKTLEVLRHNLENGEVFHGKTVNYRKNGSEFMIEWKVFPIRDASGAITHHVAVQRDITTELKPETWF